MSSHYHEKKSIKDPVEHKVVAIATYEVGAEIIVKALNFYFGDTYTRNSAVEMMNQNTANALKSIAEHAIKRQMDAEDLIEYLLEISDEMAAQALVVSMRDELKFEKPKD